MEIRIRGEIILYNKGDERKRLMLLHEEGGREESMSITLCMGIQEGMEEWKWYKKIYGCTHEQEGMGISRQQTWRR